MTATTRAIRPVVDTAVTAAGPGPGGAGALVGTVDGHVHHLHVDGDVTPVGPPLIAAVVALAATGSGAVAAGDRTGRLVITRPDATTVTVELGSRVRALAWSGDGTRLVACSQAAGLIVLDSDGHRIVGLAPSRRWRTAAWHGWNAIAPLVVGGAGGLTWIDPERAGTGPAVPRSDDRGTAGPSVASERGATASAVDPVVRRDRHPGATLAVAVDPTGPWIAAGDLRGEVRIVDGRTHEEVQISGWPEPVDLLTWLPGRARLVVAGGDEVTAWRADLPEGDEDEDQPDRCTLGGRRITALAAHPDAGLVAIGGDEGQVVIWDVDGVEADARSGPRAGTPEIATMVWDGAGDHVLVGGRAGAWWCHR